MPRQISIYIELVLIFINYGLYVGWSIGHLVLKFEDLHNSKYHHNETIPNFPWISMSSILGIC